MRLRRWMLGAGVAGAIAAPAFACDPEEMNAHLTAVCEAALAEPAALLDALRGHATETERAAITRGLAAAREACAHGDPLIGAREAARLARLAGRLEARAGVAAPIWPAQEAAR
ncbi:hypothetical protein FK498_15525 [Elioraea sp. Yellowstone]|uniref:hypothetical protein n=1 Tax=Elioraea sp. Yellowstone TaxID=2592070 RepID=UPI001153D7AC|nr:hypothetical protein [Elioraea sp. Yellowstone]TQF76869.1 hypothetical protein FK498_15525 [Elioraea sp. Yellowstone]